MSVYEFLPLVGDFTVLIIAPLNMLATLFLLSSIHWQSSTICDLSEVK